MNSTMATKSVLPALLALVPLFGWWTSTPPPIAARGECLHYRPETVSITGKLARHTFYGAPGFGEDPAHDEKETGFYLDLAAQVCTDAGRDEYDPPLKSVRRVQLVLDAAGYARLRPFLGKRVTLRGTLFAAITGHHHAPILLDVLKPVQITH
jgi:Domain of unknown function (DUF4431)